MEKNFTALIIMDGFGISEDTDGNAIKMANTPNLDALIAKYPVTQLGASGTSVGLPEGQMGNSEVGHLNIGAGRIIYQELTRISKEIEDGSFFQNEELLAAIENAKKYSSDLHVMGLLSDGGVHSHIEHLYALLQMAKNEGLETVYIHCFMDGRDVPPMSGIQYIRQLEQKIAEIGIGKIASVSGRYYAMDRDSRWERINKAYDIMVNGRGRYANSAEEAVLSSYEEGITDEFIVPCAIYEDDAPMAMIGPGDSVIFFNFRPDRAREITNAITRDDFRGFKRVPFEVYYVCFTQYDKGFDNVHVAFKPEVYQNTLGEYLALKGLKQFRIAETEKYAHVTFFFNGGVEKPNAGEDRFLIPSPKVATYDLKPEMSAYEVTEKAVELIRGREYDVMILNFANPDMVGHTGVLPAAVKAVETVDECIGAVIAAIREVGGEAIVTADHGNAEKMIDSDGGPFTAHTTNPVPLVLVSDRFDKLRDGGILADIAPTMLDLMGVEIPAEMTGKSLV